MLQVENGEHQDVSQELQAKLEALRELLVREPDKTEAIEGAMNEVNQVSLALARFLAKAVLTRANFIIDQGEARVFCNAAAQECYFRLSPRLSPSRCDMAGRMHMAK